MKKTPSITITRIPVKSYLVFIGIDNYENCVKLNNAVRDCQNVKSALLEKYYFKGQELHELYDEEATSKNILTLFKELVLKIKSNDNLILYYAGHGHYDKDLETGYWIPVNAYADDPSSQISNTILINYLRKIQARHIVLLSDSCFSRSLFIDSVPRKLEKFELDRSRWALTSGKGIVEDGIVGRNSPFALSVIEFFQKSEEEFLITDLIQYVKLNVSEIYEQIPQGAPLLGLGHEGGEYVFRLRRKFEKIREVKKHEERIEPTELSIKDYKDVQKILQLYDPRSSIKEIESYSDSTQKIGFKLFYKHNDVLKQTEYYLFLNESVILSKTYDLIKNKHPQIFKEKNLVLLFPKEKGQTQIEIRKNNINNIFKPINLFYIDEFIWDKCNPKSFTDKTEEEVYLQINNFIPPTFQNIMGELISFEQIREWIKKDNDQILVIKGTGGIGKTTIAFGLSDIFQASKEKSKILFIDSNRIVDELKRVTRQDETLSIYNFYEAEFERGHLGNDKLNKDLFRINLDSGNILLVIDGLDEIILKIPNFNINSFISSIFEYTNDIGNGKVIITCRSYFWDLAKFTSENFINSVELLPFLINQARSFFEKSFEKDAKKVSKALAIADDFSFKDDTGLKTYQPYVLDVVRNIIDFIEGAEVTGTLFESEFLDRRLKDDHIIFRICYRETIRVSQISVDEQIKFMIEFAIKCKGKIPLVKLESFFVSIFGKDISKSIVEAFKTHPLLGITGEIIRFRYDFFEEFFKAIYLKKCISYEGLLGDLPNELIEILSDDCWFNSSIIQEVKQRLTNWGEDEKLVVSELYKKIFESVALKEFKRRKTISGLFALALSMNHKVFSNNIDANTAFLKDIFLEGNKINNLSMINLFSDDENIRFDFKGLKFYNCYFDSYENFLDCRFDSETKFNKCEFQNLSISDKKVKSSGLTVHNFLDCIGDHEYIIESQIDINQSLTQQIVYFLEQFFNLFVSKGKVERQSYEIVIKRRFPSIKKKIFKLNDIVDYLVEMRVIELFKEHNEQKVRVLEGYKMDVFKFSKEGTISGKIQGIINFLYSKKA